MENIRKETLTFLSGLKKNNDRDWFNKNRDLYDSARKNFEAFVQSVIDELAKAEPILRGLEAKTCIFRINRDTRFSNDKSPYKTNFGAFIARGGKKNGDKYAGYYLHLEPGECMIAGGAYMPPADWLAGIREKIAEDPGGFTKVLNEKNFRRFFGTLEGDKLKKAPKGYDNDHPAIELLKHKSFLAVNNIPDSKVTDVSFNAYILENFRAMKPFNDYLNEALI
ncbi:MAG: DUF2461 domain-containing protein [Bacteroidales bacterium]|jgi:uncharacterized protein (TIGR02453 family)|nr:DUF2461 domain-containing protein [Bacteroidales bacterium]